ncbi:NAD(P)/FAD-dependent oxidoreductase [Prosthecomicrobium sp. N25]|uniref:NAD(P)/FAD-dependent oxidoreductase n=1 Tax=Prosthecomicrobium sp. N25 TaxID=3129254 RepID=UPI00307807AA
MGSERSRTVVVGAGQAGAWAVIALRETDPAREIVMIGDEAHLPYERPPVSKGILAGESGIEKALIRPDTWFVDNRIDLRLGQRVAGIDRAAARIELAGGERIAYDSLILATGARPRRLTVPGADDSRVHVIRTVDDSLALRVELQPERHLAVVGAGFIGLEAASVARKRGLAVTVVDVAAAALSRVVAPEVGAAMARRHEREGVAFRFGARLTGIEPGASGLRLHFAEGPPLDADVVVAGIGAVPNTELAAAAGLVVDDGIVVDAFGQTSDSAISAAGDVTRHFNPILGRSIRLESWQNAQNQAIAVGRIVGGRREPYAEVPWFWTHQYDFNLQIAGAPLGWDRVIFRGGPDEPKFTALYLAEGRVVAGNTLNNPRDMRAVKALIAGGTVVDPTALADPAVPLQSLCR